LLIPADVFIIHHGNDFTAVCENQKTYRRLFGMIFFEGSESMLHPCLQCLATFKISKKRQKSKANSFFVSRNIDLAAKTPQKRPVFSVSTKTWCGILTTKTLRQRRLRCFWDLRFLGENSPIFDQSQRD
jgi:hypothetical protein